MLSKLECYGVLVKTADCEWASGIVVVPKAVQTVWLMKIAINYIHSRTVSTSGHATGSVCQVISAQGLHKVVYWPMLLHYEKYFF